jgi:hypothetical protein
MGAHRCNSGGNGSGAGVGDGSVVQDGYQDGTPTPEQSGGILRVRQNPAMPSMNVFAPGIFALAQQLFLGYTAFDHLWFVPTDTGERELFLAAAVEQPDELTIATIGVRRSTQGAHRRARGHGRGRGGELQALPRRDALRLQLAPQRAGGCRRLRREDGHVHAEIPVGLVLTASNSGTHEQFHHAQDPAWARRPARTDAIGSGHWILDSHENGANIKLRRFPNFRTFQNGRDITGQPYLDGIDFKFIADDNVALAAFKAGDLDIGGFSGEAGPDTAGGDGRPPWLGDLSRDYISLTRRTGRVSRTGTSGFGRRSTS